MNNGILEKFEKNTKSIVIRELKWDDLPAFMDSLNEFYQESMQKDLWIPTTELSLEDACDKLSGILKNIELNKTIYLIAEVDDRIAGMAWINIHSGMFGEGYSTLSIQVGDSCRGLGIGKRFMNILEEQARKMKLRGILLTVIDRNPAMQLYERLGYREIGRKPNYVASLFGKQAFEERGDLVEMLKKL